MKATGRHTALALALALLPSVAAGELGVMEVEGRVLGVHGRLPIAGAQIAAGDLTATTDAQGRFRLELPRGTASLIVSAEGFLAETVSVTPSHLEVLLVDRARFREQVDVLAPATAAAAEGPAELPVRPAQVMAVAGAADNIFRTLQTLPGVAATEEFGSRLAVRGGGPDENLTVMDGVEIHNPYRLFGLTSAFNPETVESFELFSAAFPARYGDRLSSLLVVENGDGDASRSVGGVAALSVTDANVLAEGGLPKGKGSWLLTGRRTYYDLVANSIVGTDLPAFADVQGRLVLSPRPSHRLTLQGVASRESADSFFEGDAPDDEGGFVSGVQNDVLALSYAAPLGARGSSRTALSFYRNTETLDVTAEFRADARRSNAPDDSGYGRADIAFTRELAVRDLSLRQELHYQAGARHLFEAGFEFHGLQTRTVWNIAGDRNPFAGNGSSQQGGAGLPDVLDSQVDATRAGFWLQDRIEATPWLLLEPGLRYDWSGVNGRGTSSPRLSATVRFGQKTRLRAGFGLFTQSPGYEKLIQSDYFLDLSGRLDLDYARSTHVLVGLERDLGASLTARVEGYYKKLDDLIVGRLETEEERQARVAQYDFPLDLQASIPRSAQITSFPVNGATGQAWGFDVYLVRPAAASARLSGWAAYTYGRAERDAYGRVYPFEYDRRHALSAVGSFRLSLTLELAATIRAASGFPRTPIVGLRAYAVEDEASGLLVPALDANGLQVWEIDLGDTANLNSARLPAFGRLDLRMTFRPRGPSGRWQFYLDVINATNRENAGAIDAILEYDPASDRPRIVEKRTQALPLLPSFGVRFRF